jgi:hypothetical protein
MKRRLAARMRFTSRGVLLPQITHTASTYNSTAGVGGCRSPIEPEATISIVAAAVTRAPVVGARFIWKHWRHSTGRPWVGLNGTVVSTPHSEHSVRVSVRESPAAAGPVPVFKPAPPRLHLHGLQRLGSFLNCLSKKKSCSPAVKMNSPPQSAQVKSRSTNSIAASPVLRKRVTPRGLNRGPRAVNLLSMTVIAYSMYRGPGRSITVVDSGLQTKSELQILSSSLPVDGGSPFAGSFGGCLQTYLRRQPAVVTSRC